MTGRERFDNWVTNNSHLLSSEDLDELVAAVDDVSDDAFELGLNAHNL
jgi:hypothetical protein